MRWVITVCAVLVVRSSAVFLFPFVLFGQEYVTKPSKSEIIQKAQKLQIPFVANETQTDEMVKYYAGIFGGSIGVTKKGEIVYSLIKIQKKALTGFSNEHVLKGLVLKEEIGEGKIGGIQGEGETITKVNYFKGNNPARWKGNISTYEAVNFGEVYKGIELKLRAYGNNVEKLFCIEPFVNPEEIKIKLCGAKALKVNRKGQLEAITELGSVTFTKPIAYQVINGRRVGVDVEYKLSNLQSKVLDSKSEHRYGFKVAAYDRASALIIDPLLASTYLGGHDSDYGYSLAVDSDKNVFVAGYANSSDFPTTAGAYDISRKGGDIFVSKLNGDLTQLLASTYLGGASEDCVSSLVIDKGKNIVVVGYTASSDFPTTPGVFNTSKSGYTDAFIARLSGDLTQLLASTYLGGTSDDYANSVVLDSSGILLYVTGRTLSSDFPVTPNAYDTTYKRGDGFISKLSWNLKYLLSSTYLGGTNNDFCTSITIDSNTNIFVAGETWSSDFPTTNNAFDTSFNGGFGDAFVSKFSRDLTRLLASTFLGGTTDDTAHALAMDSHGDVYVVGQTESLDFPTTPGAYQTSFRNGDAFISKLNWNLTSLLASTYLGGSDDDEGLSLAIDKQGNIYVVGCTASSDFPTTVGSFDDSKSVLFDAFISKLSGDLTNNIASTVLGGNYRDIARSVAIDSGGNVYVTGETQSSNFPTTPGAYDTSSSDDASVSYIFNAFVSKFDSNLSADLTSTKK